VFNQAGAVVEQFSSTLGSSAYGATSNRSGSVLAVQGLTKTRISTVNAGITTAQDYSQPGTVYGHLAASDSGDTIVFGSSSGRITTIRRASSGVPFTLAYSFNAASAGTTTCLSLSGDGTIIARGSQDQNNSLITRAAAWRLGTSVQTQILDTTVTGIYGSNFMFDDLSLDYSGEKLVTAHLGLLDSSLPQVQIFQRSGSASFPSIPQNSLTLSGSALKVKLSPVGNKLAVINSDGHLDYFGNRGKLSLYDLGSDISAVGSVTAGQVLVVQVAASPGQRVSLFRSSELAQPPVPMGYLRLLRLVNPVFIGRATANSSGQALFNVPLDGSNFAAGSSHHLQGFRNGQPRTLTQSAESFTVDQ